MSGDSFEEDDATVGVGEGIVGQGVASPNVIPLALMPRMSPMMASQGGTISGEGEHGAYTKRVKKGTGGNYDNKLGPRSLLTDILSAVPELSHLQS